MIFVPETKRGRFLNLRTLMTIRWALEFGARQDLVSHGVPFQPLPPTHPRPHHGRIQLWMEGGFVALLSARAVWSSGQSSRHINFLWARNLFSLPWRDSRGGCVAYISYFRQIAPASVYNIPISFISSDASQYLLKFWFAIFEMKSSYTLNIHPSLYIQWSLS